jgi:hypothetical protein
MLKLTLGQGSGFWVISKNLPPTPQVLWTKALQCKSACYKTQMDGKSTAPFTMTKFSSLPHYPTQPLCNIVYKKPKNKISTINSCNKYSTNVQNTVDTRNETQESYEKHQLLSI